MQMNKVPHKKILIAALTALLVVGAVVYLDNFSATKDDALNSALSRARQSQERNYTALPYNEIVNPSGFVNTDPLELKDLVGEKVVLLDFMTYSCINCQRTYPYLNAWYESYKNKGLEIVGIHTPEFAFEEDIENVREAMQRFGIEFPIVLDNDYGTWNAYANRWWPRKYLIDIHGNIVYDHIGEGAYDETERKIQELLEERAVVLGDDMKIPLALANPEGAESIKHGMPQSPETYFGTLRNRYSGHTITPNGGVTQFEAPEDLAPNTLYLDGDWIVTGEYAEAASPNARILYSYQAEKVFLVMSSEEEVEGFVYIDGEQVGEAAGTHVEDGIVTIQNEQLYRLIEDPDGWGQHIVEIIFEEPGARAFAFTFG